MRSVAVVGASLAGLSAARALRTQGYDGGCLIGDEPHRPYDRPPLSKEFLAGAVGEADLALEADGEDLRRRVAARRPRHRARRGAPRRAPRRRPAVARRRRRHRDRRRGPVLPGSDGLAGVHTLRTLDDARALRDELARGGRLVVIGGGFIGAEVASTATPSGSTSRSSKRRRRRWPDRSARDGRRVSGLHADHGVRLLCGVGSAGLDGRATGSTASAGRRPQPARRRRRGRHRRASQRRLAATAPARARQRRACATRTADRPARVVAVGDCAAWYDAGVGLPPPRRALDRRARAARRRRRHAAGGGRHHGAPAEPPYFWSDQYGVKIQFAGIARPGDERHRRGGRPATTRSFLAVYRRAGQPVAVLGMNQPRLFTRWRRQRPPPLRPSALTSV